MLVISCVLSSLQFAPPPSTAWRARPPQLCTGADGAPSFRQRLREVHVDPALLAEVSAIVTHKRASARHLNGRSSARSASVGLPLYNPFGTKPRFVASADRASSLPPEALPEIAFIGRSNVGKSSLLNALTGVTTLAKVSDKVHGRPNARRTFGRAPRRLTVHLARVWVRSPDAHRRSTFSSWAAAPPLFTSSTCPDVRRRRALTLPARATSPLQLPSPLPPPPRRKRTTRHAARARRAQDGARRVRRAPPFADGFAFAKDSAVAAWRELSASYLTKRKTLKLVLVLVDARVGLKQSDVQMLAFLEAARVKCATTPTPITHATLRSTAPPRTAASRTVHRAPCIARRARVWQVHARAHQGRRSRAADARGEARRAHSRLDAPGAPLHPPRRHRLGAHRRGRRPAAAPLARGGDRRRPPRE
jgi:hypothetical protein